MTEFSGAAKLPERIHRAGWLRSNQTEKQPLPYRWLVICLSWATGTSPLQNRTAVLSWRCYDHSASERQLSAHEDGWGWSRRAGKLRGRPHFNAAAVRTQTAARSLNNMARNTNTLCDNYARPFLFNSDDRASVEISIGRLFVEILTKFPVRQERFTKRNAIYLYATEEGRNSRASVCQAK